MKKMLNKALYLLLSLLLIMGIMPITATAAEPTCKGKDDHYMECGNIGRWFASRAAAEKAIIPFLQELDAELDAQYHAGEIDYCTYIYYSHDGYEVWSCFCGKWTANAYSCIIDKDYNPDNRKPYCQWDDGTVITAATCTTKGKKKVVCTCCNDDKIVETAALGHNYQTVSGEGVAKHICERCSDEVICKSDSVGSYQKKDIEQAGINEDGKTVTSTCCSYCDLLLNETSQPINAIKTVKLSSTVYTYNGKAKKPSVIVKDRDDENLLKDTDYVISYSKGRKAVGEYFVTVSFKGNYKGSKTLKFKIIPKATALKSVKAKKKSFVAKWEKVSGVKGYQLQYATNKKFTKGKKTKTVKGAKKTSATIKKLKKNKKYFVRVRTYKIVNGKKVYSKWSKAKTVKPQ